MLIAQRTASDKAAMALSEAEHQCIGLLTQSDMIRFLAQNVAWMKRVPYSFH